MTFWSSAIPIMEHRYRELLLYASIGNEVMGATSYNRLGKKDGRDVHGIGRGTR